MQQRLIIIFFFLTTSLFAQNIKSIQLRPLEENNFSIIVPLGKTLELSFDDLEGDQKNYYYKIELMTHDWKSTRLLSSQYIDGFQSNPILNVENSFNTFQNYTHYTVQFPNINTRIKKSGNYLVSILDEYDDVVFTRRFTLYESITPVGVTVSRSRNAKTVNEQQNVRFFVNHPTLQINNPQQEIHIAILQNQNWQTAITDIQPQFFKQNQLVYNYVRKTNFWAGNEYLFFDSKIIQNASINIRSVVRRDIFHNYLYPYVNKEVKSYTYNPDINGQFVVRTIEASNSRVEADYARMYFTLQVENEFANKEVYVYGAFNNFALNEENKMIFDPSTNSYFSNFLLKQGFYNYTYVTKDADGFISQSDVRGDFSKTENEYTVLVYYKPMGGLFDRVVGVSSIKFFGER